MYVLSQGVSEFCFHRVLQCVCVCFVERAVVQVATVQTGTGAKGECLPPLPFWLKYHKSSVVVLYAKASVRK